MFNYQGGVLQGRLTGRPGLFGPGVVVGLIEEELVACVLVKRMKPWALLLAGLRLPLG